MAKIKVQKEFIDSITKERYKVGDEVEINDDLRVTIIVDRGLGVVLDEKPKAKPRKKKAVIED